MRPPFEPVIKDPEDTHYFDEEGSISDVSSSAVEATPASPKDIADALKNFPREIQIITSEYVRQPYDSIKLRKIDHEIDAFMMCEEQKEYLKMFVKQYGIKERKRPRDRILRDKEVASKVLELRKCGAFLGYTYRRMRTSEDSVKGKRPVWHRARLSIS